MEAGGEMGGSGSLAPPMFDFLASPKDVARPARGMSMTRNTVPLHHSDDSVHESYMRPTMRTLKSQINSETLEDSENASPLRKRLAECLGSMYFHTFIVLTISCNAVIIVLETNLQAECLRVGSCSSEFALTNKIILGIYTLELLLRLFVHRRAFWSNRWNLLDASVVALGAIDVVFSDWSSLSPDQQLPEVGFLRLFRVMRLTRLTKLLKAFPELYNMISRLFHAIRAMVSGVIIILVVLFMFAVVTVEVVYPLALRMAEEDGAYAECAQEFSTVGQAIITFFQTMVAGDSWGKCSVPLIREKTWVFLVLGVALVTVQLGLMNLVLSGILESAYRDREAEVEARKVAQFEEEKGNVIRILEFMKQIDTDGNGEITLDELQTGCHEREELRELFASLEIDTKDLGSMFNMMDIDSDGSVSYAEFIELIQKCQAQDVKLQIMFLKLQMSQMKMSMTTHMESSMAHVSKELGCLHRALRGEEVAAESLFPDKVQAATPGLPRMPQRDPDSDGHPARYASSGGAGPGSYDGAGCAGDRGTQRECRAGGRGDLDYREDSCEAPGGGAPLGLLAAESRADGREARQLRI